MSCQVIDMARRYGWTIALTREDHICSLGIAALGFEKPRPATTSGTLCEGMYTETKEAGQRSEAAVDKFAPGEYAGLAGGALSTAPRFEPHLVCVYANPAQVMRLTQAALWKRGGKLASSFGGPRRLRRDHRHDHADRPAAGDPALLRRPHLRPDAGPRDGLHAFRGPGWRRSSRACKGTHDGRHPLPDHPVHGVRGEAAAAYMEANRSGTSSTAARLTNRDRVVAAYKRSFADRVPVYPIVALVRGHARRPEHRGVLHQRPTKAITAMMNYYERYQPDVVLAYNDLAKEAEAFGCRVKYSDYVVPSIDAHVLHDDKAQPGPARDARPVRDRAAARLPRAVRGPRQGQAPRPPSARSRSGPGRSPCCCATPRRCCSTPSRTRSSSTTSCGVTTDFCKLWGDAIAKTGIGLSFSEPTASISLISPDNYREFVAPYHKELVDHFKAKKVGVTTHICGTTYPIYEDLIRLRLHDGLLRPRPAGGSRAARRPARSASWRWRKGRAVAIGNVDATKFEKHHARRRWRPTCGAASTRRPGTRRFILSTSCEIPPRSEPRDRQVVHGRGARVRPLRPDLRRAERGRRGEPGRGSALDQRTGLLRASGTPDPPRASADSPSYHLTGLDGRCA